MRLLKLELLKIVRRKITIITIIGSLLLSVFFCIFPAVRYIAYDESGNPLTGITALKTEKKLQFKVSGSMSEERIKNDIKEYQTLFSDSDNVEFADGEWKFKDKLYWEYYYPRSNYLKWISVNYNPSYLSTGIAKLADIGFEEGSGFYDTREMKIRNLLNMDYLTGNYSDAEKEFWRSKNLKVEIPLRFGYYEGWKNLISNQELYIFTIFAICICVAPVFAGEYQAGTDSVILSSKYGKSKVISAKLGAGFLFATIVFLCNILIATGGLLLFGFDGGNLPVQIMDTIIPYPLTFFQVAVIGLIVSYIVMIAFCSFTLLLSAKMKSPFLVILIDSIVMILPIFMSISTTNKLLNNIFYLLPYRVLQPALDLFQAYHLGTIIVDVYTMRCVVYTVIAVVCIPITARSFRKHQVSQ